MGGLWVDFLGELCLETASSSAIRRLSRDVKWTIQILSALSSRVDSSFEEEMECALFQVNKIAWIRGGSEIF
jgi:hypothetical protein